MIDHSHKIIKIFEENAHCHSRYMEFTYWTNQEAIINPQNHLREKKRSRSKENTKCIACSCNSCQVMRAKISTKPKHDTAVNIVHDDMVVNLCDTYAVENIQRGEKVMIFDPRATVNLAGWP